MKRRQKNITFKLGPIQYRRVGVVRLLQVGRLDIWSVAGRFRIWTGWTEDRQG